MGTTNIMPENDARIEELEQIHSTGKLLVGHFLPHHPRSIDDWKIDMLIPIDNVALT